MKQRRNGPRHLEKAIGLSSQILPTSCSEGASVFWPFFPLRGADFARMSGDILRGLDLAKQVRGVAADAFSRHFHRLDDAVGIDDERATIGQAFVLAHDFEIARDRAGRIADHRVLDLADRFGAVVPSLVCEVRVRRDRVDLDAEPLQFSVMIGEIAEFGRANEGEVGRIEEEDRPFALDVGFGDLNELALLESLSFERLDRGIDKRHRLSWSKVAGKQKLSRCNIVDAAQ